MKTIYQEGLLTVRANIEMTAEVRWRDLEEGLREYTFDLAWNPKEAALPGSRVSLLWELPGLDVQYMWHPDSRARRVLDSNWRLHLQSMLTGSAPMAVTFNGSGESIYAFAASEIRKAVSVHMGVSEYKHSINTEIAMGLEQMRDLEPRASLRVRADCRHIPFHRAITETVDWWHSTLAITPMPVPEACLMPLYSSWYNFHQAVDALTLEEECALARQLGMDSIILDDGWHSSHDGPGYGYTGDWEVCREKFPDMRAHVRRVHELGMKYMVWFSVPFMGYHARNWGRFRDKLLRRIDRNACGVLDPRYPDVREYLIGIYENAVRDYDLDGLKLDFIDQFEDRDHLPLHPEMDYACVQEATERLMTDVMERLRNVKPDIMIEFRQRYIGPAMHRFGNMFRVGDCASDIVSNRVGVTDLRLLSGGQAVHSDMLTWNNQETPEHAALQLLNVIFGVVQFSQRIGQMPESHVQMTRFWLDFARRYRKVLLESELIPLEPQFMYPVIKAQDDTLSIIAVYAPHKIVDLDRSRAGVKLINATHAPVMYLQMKEPLAADVTVRDTCGRMVWKQAMEWQPGIITLDVPCSGLAEFDSIR